MIKRVINWFLSFFRRKKTKIKRKEYEQYNISEKDIEIKDLIDSYRKNKGLTTLTWFASEIDDIALAHCKWLEENIKSKEEFEKHGHDYQYDRVDQIQLRLGCYNCAIGEVVSREMKSPLSVFSGWKNSPSHNEAMLNPSYTHIGIATTNNYTTVIFYEKR